jgi:hypothetical protein
VNDSSASASAGNANQVTQSATQQQEAGGSQSGGPTQLGGTAQSQIVQQSAPTTQTALADATSIQSDMTNMGMDGSAIQTNISSAASSVSNSNNVIQNAEQAQQGDGGSQLQVIGQDAPITQITSATATSTQSGATNAGGRGSQTSTSSSTSTAGKSSDTTQRAEQTQEGGDGQAQVVEQSSAPPPVGKHRTSRPGWQLTHAVGFWAKPDVASWLRSNSARSAQAPQPLHRSGAPAPRDPRAPTPQQSPMLGGPAGAATGGSLWIFAALLVPFALTAPWWARRHRSVVLRRLLSVVLRLERPG